MSILTLPADNGTWSVTLVTSSRDRAMRGLRDPARWDAALALYPLAAHWRDGEPITGVDVIAGIEDRHRDFVVDGDPVATGVVAVGDAWACTNPSLGRGATIGLLHAGGLRDVLRETGADDHDKLVRRFHEWTTAAVEPLYRRHPVVRPAPAGRTRRRRRRHALPAPTTRDGRSAWPRSPPAAPTRTSPAPTSR